MMKIATATLLSCLAALASCAADAPRSEFRLALDGSIDEAVVERISIEIAKRPKGSVVLEVRSTGGNSLAAMKLGDTMLRHDVAMLIKQYCHSACSQYLLPSATSVEVEGNASIAFHGTPSWIVPPDTAPEGIKAYFADFREKEERFLSARGVDYNSWLWVQQHKRPFCWFENSAAPANSPDRYGTASRVNIVAPSRSVLEQLGTSNLQGAVPNSAKEAWEFATQSGFRSSITVAFVDKVGVPENWDIPKFDQCDDLTTQQILNS